MKRYLKLYFFYFFLFKMNRLIDRLSKNLKNHRFFQCYKLLLQDLYEVFEYLYKFSMQKQ